MQRRFDLILTELLREIDAPYPRNEAPSGAVSEKGADFLCPGGEGFGSHALLVAVSGGVDSMSLANLCLNYGRGLRTVVAHCNFHLRGEESDGDEAFVRLWCRERGVEIRVADFDTVSYARERGLSVEMAARELRYEWFARLCRETGCRAVAVAHNANDNAETLFLNLLRGTGLRGICGMKPLSVVPVGDKIPLLRPLLSFTREQIEAYAVAHGIHWREDRTNADSGYRRNLIRNKVFPLLHTVNASFVETLNREMRYFSEACGIVDDSLPDLVVRREGPDAEESRSATEENGPHPEECRAVIRENTVTGRINIRELLGHAHWPYLLYMSLEPYGFSSATVEDLENCIRKALVPKDGAAAGKMQGGKMQGGKIFLSETHSLRTTAEELVIEPIKREGKFIEIFAAGPGFYRADGRTVTADILDREAITDLKPPKGTLYMDADKVGFPFVIRSWKSGDWLRPFGMGGRRKKVSDLFNDLGYGPVEKAGALFIEKPAVSGETHGADKDKSDFQVENQVVDNETAAVSTLNPEWGGGRVYALLGERIDEEVKVTSATGKILRITVR